MSWPALTLAETHARMTAPGAVFEMAEADIRGVPTRVWKNAPATLREVFVNARAAHGAKTFLVYEGERASFEAFSRASLALAAVLAEFGVTKGDRVALAMRNNPEWAVVAMATLLLGAVITPLNAWGTGPELVYGVSDSGARVLVADGERWARIEPLCEQLPLLQRVLLSRTPLPPDQPSLRSLQSLIGGVADWAALPPGTLPDVALDPDDDATLFYTSGTTGAAKGVLATHRCCTSTLMAGMFSVQRNFVRRGEPIPDPAARATQRVQLLSVPLFHTTGCQVILFGALSSGTRLVLMHHWDAERAFALIEAERVTQAGGVPTIAWQLIEHPARASYDLSSLESVSYGGAPASAALVQRIGEAFAQVQPGTGWGMTETTGTFTHHGAEDYLNRPDSAGPSLPVGEMMIRDDDDGVPLAHGQVGELWVKGPNVVKGYWNKPEDTERTFVGGWLRTGDLGYLDDEGFLFIVDRKKDMLIRGGENIYCAEVEAVLYRHPAVMDAGVIGIAHHQLGEEPAALVTLTPGAQASEAELREFVRSQLASFKVPVRIKVHDAPLPRNPNGKLLKKVLKQLFETLA